MKVTVLIVNYNNWQDTIECLESVLKSNYKDFEVIVVDNSPDDISINNLQEWAKGKIKVNQTAFPKFVFPEVSKPLNYVFLTEEEYYNVDNKERSLISFIKAQNNKGFAAANNIVLKKIIKTHSSDFVFLLNNDTVITNDTILNLVDNYNKVKVGIAGCVLLEYNNPKAIQSVGGKYNKLFGTTSQILEGSKVMDLERLKLNVKIDYPCGAAMFLSIRVLKEIGHLNESYFLYYEELDWIQRTKLKYSTTFFKNCFVYHKGGVSIGSNNKSYLADKYSLINRINFAKRYNRSNLITIYIGVLGAIFKRILLFKFYRSFCLIKDVLKNEN